MGPIMWVLAAAAAVAAAWTSTAVVWAEVPGSEDRIAGIAAELLPALARWGIASLAPMAVLRLFGPSTRVAGRLWRLWVGLAAVQLALLGGVEITALSVRTVVDAHVMANVVAAFATGLSAWRLGRPPGLHYGLLPWTALGAFAVAVLAGWGTGPAETRINLQIDKSSLQLLELLPLSLALGAAALGACVREGTLTRRHVLLWAAAAIGMLLVTASRIDDRGAVLITLVALALLGVWLLDIDRRVPVVVAAPLLLALGLWAIAMAPGQAGALVDLRLAMRADPFENGLRNGDQLGLSMLAVEAGQLTGRGLGSVRAASVPVGDSDMVLARLAEAWGLLGVLAWVGTFVGLLAVLLGGASRADPAVPGRGRGPAAVACVLAARFIVNISGVSGVAPLTGVVCPLLSAGDSALVTTFAVLGMALADVGHGGRAVRAHHRRELAAVLATVLVFLALPVSALGVQATAVWRGADHAGLVTQAESGKLMFVPAPALAGKLERVTRLDLSDRDGARLASTAPDGSRIAAGPPSLREVIGRPGDTVGTLESSVDQPRPPLDLGPGWLVDARTGVVVGRGDVAVPGTRVERPRMWDLRTLRGVDAPVAPRVRSSSLDRGLAWRLDPLMQEALAAVPAAAAAILVLRDERGAVLLELVVRRAGLSEGRYAVANLAESLWAPPGSQLKILVAAAADIDGVPRDTILACGKLADGRGYVRVCGAEGCEIIRDFPRGRHSERLSIPEMAALSCNAAAIELALLRPTESFPDLIAGATGRAAPDLTRTHARAEAAVGQGMIELTPARMSAAMWAATGAGTLPACGVASAAPCAQTEWLPPATAEWTRSLMEGVVSLPGGTGARARVPGLTVAAKTGSAQESPRNDDPLSGDDAWMSGDISDTHGHRVQFTFMLVHGDVPGGRWAASVPPLAAALVDEGYLHLEGTSDDSTFGAAYRRLPPTR